MEFEIAGHTDTRGRSHKNQALSQARAQTVANYFTMKGVDAKRLKVMGHGIPSPLRRTPGPKAVSSTAVWNGTA